MAKKKENINEAYESFSNLYAGGGIVNLGENPRYPVKVSTGRPSIDYLTDGGIPKGRLILIAGEPSAGKSSLTIQIAESLGKKILYCDTEMTLTTDYIEQLGANPKNFNHVIPITTEEMCNIIRKQIPNYDVIIVDSINNSASGEQQQKTAEEKTMANRARVMSEQLPILIGLANQYNTNLIILSQVRDNMNKANKYSPDTVVPGGRSLHHNSSMTLELFSSSKKKEDMEDGISNKAQAIVGKMVRIKCTKNKVGKVDREVAVEFVYGEGYTIYADYAAAALSFGILNMKGSWVNYNDESLVQGKDNLSRFLKENEQVFIEIKDAVDHELKKILSNEKND